LIYKKSGYKNLLILELGVNTDIEVVDRASNEMIKMIKDAKFYFFFLNNK